MARKGKKKGNPNQNEGAGSSTQAPQGQQAPTLPQAGSSAQSTPHQQPAQSAPQQPSQASQRTEKRGQRKPPRFQSATPSDQSAAQGQSQFSEAGPSQQVALGGWCQQPAPQGQRPPQHTAQSPISQGWRPQQEQLQFVAGPPQEFPQNIPQPSTSQGWRTPQSPPQQQPFQGTSQQFQGQQYQEQNQSWRNKQYKNFGDQGQRPDNIKGKNKGNRQEDRFKEQSGAPAQHQQGPQSGKSGEAPTCVSREDQSGGRGKGRQQDRNIEPLQPWSQQQQQRQPQKHQYPQFPKPPQQQRPQQQQQQQQQKPQYPQFPHPPQQQQQSQQGVLTKKQEQQESKRSSAEKENYPTSVRQVSAGSEDTDKRMGSEAKSTPASSTGPGQSAKQAPSKTSPYNVLRKQAKLGTMAVCRRDRGEIVVQSNHFALRMAIKQAYHYHVDIKEHKKQEEAPSKQDTSKLRRIKSNVLYQVLNIFLDRQARFTNSPRRYPSFDGKCNLYASNPLSDNLHATLMDTDITAKDEYGKEKSFTIEIKFANKLLINPITVQNAKVLSQDALQCLNVIFQAAAVQQFTQIGSSYFRKPLDRNIDLGGGMEMYYGFYQSVISGGRPLLNVALRHKAFLKNEPVIRVLLELLAVTRRSRDPLQPQALTRLNYDEKKVLNSRLFNVKVEYEVPRYPKVTYRVNELAGSANDEKIDGGKSVVQYFRECKNVRLQFSDLPLLSVGRKNCNIKIPLEFCTIKTDQCVKGLLPDVQTSKMIQEAATDTIVHRETIEKRVREVNYAQSPYLAEFGLSVGNNFEETKARVLKAPTLAYGNGRVEPKQGKWNNMQFLETKKIGKWAILSLDYFQERDMKSFENALHDAAKRCGMQFTSNAAYQIGIGMRGQVKEAHVQEWFRNNRSYEIVFIIIPDFKPIYYSYVKRVAELEMGCVTQCVKAKTAQRINYSTAQNILLKVNSKLGGVNHQFADVPDILKRSPCMIIGADVTHPPASSGGAKQGDQIPSIVSVIASYDARASKYNFAYSLQESRLEYIMNLKEIVKRQLKFFYDKNRGVKPEKIIYLRDGVSDGMFEDALHIELKAIKEATKELQRDGYDPAVMFMVVQKRHHTRLFPKNSRDSEDGDRQTPRGLVRGNYNVPAGTCVDTNIVEPTMQNYYLVSHASLKGVARPTKYVTLWDDMNLDNDVIQSLTYYLCHMFTRCTRAVSYPAPTYYAHLGALRGKAYIKPAIENLTFDFDDLNGEMGKNKIKDEILNNFPMFFV